MVDIQTEIILIYYILHNYLIEIDPDEKLIDKVDWEILNQSLPQEEAPTPMDDDEDAMWGEFLRNYMTLDIWNYYIVNGIL